jgi:hypothetical protein
MNGDVFMKENYKPLILYLSLGGLFILGVLSAFWRMNQAYSPDSILVSIYAQQTVCDVLYVYLCSAEYFIQNGCNTDVLGNLFLGLFPGDFYALTSGYNFTNFLRENFAYNAGGGLFFSEGMIAFGAPGVPLYMGLLAYLIKYVYLHKGRLYSGLFILLMVMMCRIMWYGFIYTYKSVILVVIILSLINAKHSYFIHQSKLSTKA